MLSQKFYWGTIRKAIIAFGNMFNNIHIDRRDDNGNIVQTLKIPLAYAPRQKFIARIQARPVAEEQNFQVILPRMGFEMIGIDYDPSRKISLVQQNRNLSSSTSTLNTQYAPTPYNLIVNLYIYAKNQDDGLQIVEQILPYFNPDFNLTINSIPALNIKNDLPILLNSLSYDDQYEGDFSQRRAIIWTLSFIIKLNFFGPINKQGMIKKTIVSTYNDKELSNKTTQHTAAVDPLTALPDDDYDIIETFEEF